MTNKKGLRLKEVPAPLPPPSPSPLVTKAEIILDALQEGGTDWDASVRYLDGYIAGSDADNFMAKEALSYIEGLRAGAAAGDDLQSKKAYDAGSEALLEVVRKTAKHEWKWPTGPRFVMEKINPAYWKTERTNALLNALEQGKGSWERSISYLEEKGKKEGPEAQTAREALEYLQGFHAYCQHLEQNK